MFIFLCLEYYEIFKLNKLFNLFYSFKICFSIFYCNIRSLLKNFFILEDWLYFLEKKFDILVILEIKLNSKFIINIDIFQYYFFYIDFEIVVGGVVFYIFNNLKVIFRVDIKFIMFLVEFCWVEIIVNNNKLNIIIGCIYRYFLVNMLGFI